jgi:hypothetical protein
MSAHACGSYTLNSQTYTTSGVYVQHFVNYNGCDSALTLNVIIHGTDSTGISTTGCGSYTLNSQTYSASGVYSQTLTNSCWYDSVITLNLTLFNNAHSINVNSCGSYTLNGQTYNSTGTYVQHLTNHHGCDSALTIHLAIHNDATFTSATSCSDYTLNSQTYTASGVYTQHLTNVFGCDSMVVLNLTISPLVATVTQAGNMLSTNIANAIYQWINCDSISVVLPISNYQGYVPVTVGSYAVVVSDNGCTDTSSCFNFLPVVVENIIDNNSITISPNPFTSVATIYFSEEQRNTSIKVIDVTGRLVNSEQLTGNSAKLDMSGYAKGIYFVRIEDEKKNVVNKKIVKQ